MLKIAIVGNIAAGKSSVEKLLKGKNFKVYDTDLLCHDILDNSKDKIIETFSDYDILDENNNISRKKLGDIVFEHTEYKNKLEGIIYPQLKENLTEIFKNNQSENFLFISIPLLFEVGWENLFDKILFVYADDDLRLKRLMARNSLTEEQAKKRLLSQKPQEDKIKKSDFIIRNNDDILSLQKEIDEFIILLKDME